MMKRNPNEKLNAFSKLKYANLSEGGRGHHVIRFWIVAKIAVVES